MTREEQLQQIKDQMAMANVSPEAQLSAEEELRKARMGEDDFRHTLRQRLMQMMGKQLNPEDMPIE